MAAGQSAANDRVAGFRDRPFHSVAVQLLLGDNDHTGRLIFAKGYRHIVHLRQFLQLFSDGGNTMAARHASNRQIVFHGTSRSVLFRHYRDRTKMLAQPAARPIHRLRIA